MRERPILFNAPMVRAIFAGKKTKTRLVVELRNGQYMPPSEQADPNGWDQFLRLCPYGQPGDRLWVRESGWERPERTAKMMREGADTWPRYAYAADDWDDQDRVDFKAWGFKSRPSIHMPRWASRILLEIVSVRVEKLNDISEAEAEAEGVELTVTGDGWRRYCSDREQEAAGVTPCGTAYASYRSLWESINGPDSWSANPWVWVIEFRVLEGGAQ